eukprot:g56047.t1
MLPPDSFILANKLSGLPRILWWQSSDVIERVALTKACAQGHLGPIVRIQAYLAAPTIDWQQAVTNPVKRARLEREEEKEEEEEEQKEATENGDDDYDNILCEEDILAAAASGNLKGASPLYFAAANGHLAVVRFLVWDGGADVNKTTARGRTPLYAAAGNGHLQVVKWLVEWGGADVDRTTRRGRTALLCAMARGQEGVVRWLAEARLPKATSACCVFLGGGCALEGVVRWLAEARLPRLVLRGHAVWTNNPRCLTALTLGVQARLRPVLASYVQVALGRVGPGPGVQELQDLMVQYALPTGWKQTQQAVDCLAAHERMIILKH